MPSEPPPDLAEIERRLVECSRCRRLRDWCDTVARERRAAFRHEEYWGRPVPGFGDPRARLLVLGLAPAAHGANRTGRMFTGDRSGDWLFRALHRAGFAEQPTSVSADDGQRLADCYVTSVVHCAPPANRPTGEEQANCAFWVNQEVAALDRLRVVVVLGGLAFRRWWSIAAGQGWAVPRPLPAFGHGVVVSPPDGPLVVSSYHPSQQNTFTGRLTEEMFGAVFAAARRHLD